ncbi:MAG: hypothetical protein KatS3mg003_2234 [Candidatus Nitrosocaldaceae archaeon]|nr:MAG: hypothetical protein KatS3mg003_2164 [Candidatus Nitrosocaldaceae archaeon]GIU72755.1 MAG: hypothetical protein KatS3mg003_2234 [Candidatus Nitrosocaldaceae archaeon]
MTMNRLQDILRKILNDRDIFATPHNLEPLIDSDTWSRLRELVKNGKRDEFISLIDERYKKVRNYYYKKESESLLFRYNSLKKAYDNRQTLLKELLDNLGWFGLVYHNLPNMNEIGVIIERYTDDVVKAYFQDKIDREDNPDKKNALRKVLMYYIEMRKCNIPRSVIAYFIRKLNTLVNYWGLLDEPIKNNRYRKR